MGIMRRSFNRKFQELLEVTNAVIFQVNVEGAFLCLNSEWENLSGYSGTASIGTLLFDYILHSDSEKIRSMFQELISGRQDGLHEEVRFRTKDGVEKTVHLFLKADAKEGGSVVVLAGTLTELTSRWPEIDEFMENEGNFRFISDNMTDMIAVLAEDGLVLYASPSHTTILGRRLEEYVGSFPIRYMHPDDWERVFHAFYEAVRSWSVFETEYRYMHANGSWIHIEMRGRPTRGPDGKLQVISVSRDVTARKRMEEELRQTTLKLETLIASLPFGVRLANDRNMPILTNDVYNRMAKETLGAAGKDTDDSNQASAGMADAGIHSGQAEIINNRRTVIGEELGPFNGVTIERDAVPLLDHSRFEGYLWIYRDISEKKWVEKHLQEANELLHKLSMVDGLTSIANRRRLDEELESGWSRQGEPISLLLLDIDHFKSYNELYGHQAGDSCLMTIGRILRQFQRSPDELVARYGGEEFAVLLFGKSQRESLEMAASICRSVKDLQLPHKGSAAGKYLTLSIGISCKTPSRPCSPAGLIAEAEQALNEAKSNGRNQYRLYRPKA